MAKIQFVEWNWNNILSYGNGSHKVTPRLGMHWVRGSNGAGKSAIVEGLNFALFGSPYRSLKKKGMIRNTCNKGKARGEVVFRRISAEGTDEYRIIRELGSSGSPSVEIQENGQKVDVLAGGGQAYIEEKLGFNSQIFEQVISLNTIQTVPFIEMPAADKRSLLDSVLNVRIDRYKDLNKENLRESTSLLNIAKSDVVKYTNDLTELTRIRGQLVTESLNRISELERQLGVEESEKTEMGTKLSTLSTLLESETDAYRIASEALGKLTDPGRLISMLDNLSQAYSRDSDIASRRKELFDSIESTKNTVGDDVRGKITEVTKAIADIRLEIRKVATNEKKIEQLISEKEGRCKHIEAEGKAMKAGVPCTMCGKPNTEEDIAPNRDRLRAEYRSVRAEIAPLVNQLNTLIGDRGKLETKLFEIEPELKNLETIESTASVRRGNLNMMESNLRSMDAAIASMNVTATSLGMSVGWGKSDIDGMKISLESASNAFVDASKAAGLAKSAVDARNTEIRMLTYTIGEKTKAITALSESIGKLKSNASDVSISMIDGKIESCQGSLEFAQTEVSRLSDDLAICRYCESMYDDDGIKKFILGIFVPELNTAIANNFRLFSVPFEIKFNESMDDEFIQVGGHAPSYSSLSQGQRRKANFAIAMAFRDFVTKIADFDINLLWLDEVIDVSTDDEALNQMLELLKVKSRDIGSIYIVSHRASNSTEMFDGTVTVSHDGMYSTLVEN
jgi:DNA repair exonuclease SbcCD ATPase subunit